MTMISRASQHSMNAQHTEGGAHTDGPSNDDEFEWLSGNFYKAGTNHPRKEE